MRHQHVFIAFVIIADEEVIVLLDEWHGYLYLNNKNKLKKCNTKHNSTEKRKRKGF